MNVKLVECKVKRTNYRFNEAFHLSFNACFYENKIQHLRFFGSISILIIDEENYVDDDDDDGDGGDDDDDDDVSDTTLEDSGNYTCEIRGPGSAVLAKVTHYLFIKSYFDYIFKNITYKRL